MAAVGQNQLKTYQFLAEEFNKKNAAGVKFEIIGIDNKLSPQESHQRAASSAIDQGVRYVAAGQRLGRRRWPSSTPSTSTTSAIPARKCSTSTTPRSTPT